MVYRVLCSFVGMLQSNKGCLIFISETIAEFRRCSVTHPEFCCGCFRQRLTAIQHSEGVHKEELRKWDTFGMKQCGRLPRYQAVSELDAVLGQLNIIFRLCNQVSQCQIGVNTSTLPGDCCKRLMTHMSSLDLMSSTPPLLELLKELRSEQAVLTNKPMRGISGVCCAR